MGMGEGMMRHAINKVKAIQVRRDKIAETIKTVENNLQDLPEGFDEAKGKVYLAKLKKLAQEYMHREYVAQARFESVTDGIQLKIQRLKRIAQPFIDEIAILQEFLDKVPK
jgi:hypothetical protein